MALGQQFTVADLALALGADLPGLGLDLSTGLEIVADWSLDFGFGVSLTDGFYLKTEEGDELEATLRANLASTRTDGRLASGKLLFFEAVASDLNSPSHVQATFGLDMLGTQGRLRLADLFAGPIDEDFDVTLAADADIDLGLRLEVAGDASLPSLSTSLSVDWHWELGQALGLPNVSLNHVTLDLGSVVTDFLRPIGQRIQDTLAPFRPVIDILTRQIDGMTDSRLPEFVRRDPTLIGLVNIINFMMGKPAIDWSFVKAAKGMFEFVDRINELAIDPNLRIDLGSITDLLRNPRAVGGGSFANPFAALDAIALGAGQTFNEFNPAGMFEERQVSLVLDGILTQQLYQAGSGQPAPERPAVGLHFWDHITSIDNWMKILTGGDAVLFTYTMPELKAEFGFETTLFRWFAIAVKAFGGLSLKADLTFGYDTFGVRQAINSGNGWDALDGFFVSDNHVEAVEYFRSLLPGRQAILGRFEQRPDGRTVFDLNDINFNANIGLFAGADVLVAEAGIEGRIDLDIGFNFNDINNDGRIRGNEIGTMLAFVPEPGKLPSAGTRAAAMAAIGGPLNLF
ncbi:MAG: hypothetical protein ACOYLX_22045, partial [Burkholderiaceae bacterium]